jgi:accessory gene regulator B
MVESLALRIAEALKRIEPERTASVPVMKFALEGLLNSLITLLLIGCAGLATGAFGETMLAFGAFAVLRFFSGGMHLRSAMHCSLVSSLLIAATPHIPVPKSWIIGLGAASVLLILVLAPANIEGYARIPKKYFPLLKGISVLIAASNFVWLSSTVALVNAIQAATLIQTRRRR